VGEAHAGGLSKRRHFDSQPFFNFAQRRIKSRARHIPVIAGNKRIGADI
jgi:hypothetical protein